MTSSYCLLHQSNALFPLYTNTSCHSFTRLNVALANGQSGITRIDSWRTYCTRVSSSFFPTPLPSKLLSTSVCSIIRYPPPERLTDCPKRDFSCFQCQNVRKFWFCHYRVLRFSLYPERWFGYTTLFHRKYLYHLP